ncbi:MAG: hypothetical protein ABEL51_15190 [Salinibacter sp.]
MRPVLGCALLPLLLAGPSVAQPTPPVDSFDLVLVGQQLDAPAHQIALKSDRWVSVDSRSTSGACPTQPRLHVVPEFATARFLGQDIRENYVALKITTTRDTIGTLRAAYALPTVAPLSGTACRRLASLIATDPATVRRHSVAGHVRPRPASLSPEAPLIEHLEAPVRHRKPGVMEVKWLEILFAPEE